MFSASIRHFLSGATAAAMILVAHAGDAVAQGNNAGVTPGPADISGVVTGRNGPEAGVWVIAETTDLPTRFTKIVVTDEKGRYLVPDLPKANYTVWVRGYGLVDSPKIRTRPGRVLNLKAVVAPNAAAAAQYYPAEYWWAMLKIPGKNEFPGTGPSGNGISPGIKTQGRWLDIVKTD